MTRRLVPSPNLAAIFAAAGALWLIGCQVYDPELLEEGSTSAGVRRGKRQKQQDAGESDASPEADVLQDVAAISCGNGVVDEGEVCDIAIARGQAGACPDGCSGGHGCMRNELEGSACEARCVEREITHAESGDGCCPSGMDYYQDDDCAPRCGNDHLEPGERCDPASSCPTPAACKASDACQVARYLGDADSCNARCEMTRITSCAHGDGCCPSGCDRSRDDDCPQTCTGPNCNEPMPTPNPFVCGDAHKGSACRDCDCAQCGAQVSACLVDEAMDAMFCEAAIACGEREHCKADACYCGEATPQACSEMPSGKCVMEWNAAARTNNPQFVLFATRSPTLTVGKAAALIKCREQHCAKECGL
ncbi:MAG TPA: hypothetical protein VJV78_27720 [Polyangiales bacterium]|nr:hypothetical protein [Polyangiales bacterium]